MIVIVLRTYLHHCAAASTTLDRVLMQDGRLRGAGFHSVQLQDPIGAGRMDCGIRPGRGETAASAIASKAREYGVQGRSVTGFERAADPVLLIGTTKKAVAPAGGTAFESSFRTSTDPAFAVAGERSADRRGRWRPAFVPPPAAAAERGVALRRAGSGGRHDRRPGIPA